MKFSRSKTMATAIALFLVLTIAVTLVALPVANAHTPAWAVPTWAYVAVAPNPCGVDQTVIVVFWLDKIPPTAGGSGGDRWRNFAVTITKPDGSNETLGPFVSDPVGGGYTSYTPDQVGTYTFVFSFPGQVASLYGPTGIPGGASDYINDTYLASSATTTLTVQQTPIAPVPDYPLPTSFWMRPIEGENTAWASIASNWLIGAQIIGRVQPDGIAPNSAHIMWTKPILFGGIVGGNYSIPATFYSGLSYESYFVNPIIMYGRLYYVLPRSDAATGNGYVCVDLVTGEQVFWQNMTQPTIGQFYDYESPNQHGVIPNGYLWRTVTDSANGGTVWMAYDPLDGNWLFNETNVPSGTQVYGPNGEILIYQMNYAARWLACWNNTAAPGCLLAATSTGAWQWRPIGKNINASTAYSWNVTMPDLPGMGTPSILKVIPDDLILGTEGTFGGVSATNAGGTVWAISLKPSSRGSLLWIKNYPAPSGNISRTLPWVDPVSRVFVFYDKETMQWSGYSIDDGTKLWGPTLSEPLYSYYNAIAIAEFSTVAYGHLFTGGYSGILTCYDLKTGDILWKYNNTNSGQEVPYGNYPLSIGGVANGKVYVYTSEHSPNDPPYKGVSVRCINATNGQEIWKIFGWGSGGAGVAVAIADGYYVYLNLYDMQIYCFGKGPSATTVSIQSDVITYGNSVLIKGTVADTSAGTNQNEQAARFPNGVPAMSDEDMGAWMEYVYMQKPRPTDAKGVEVSLDTIDPNGNYVHIGTVTSDINGMFSYMYTPEVPGKYTIIATFAGSESYWGSYAETAVGVSEAPPATAPPEYPQPIDPTLTIIGVGIAIIIAVVLVGIWIKRSSQAMKPKSTFPFLVNHQQS
jgi:hypothetical protein